MKKISCLSERIASIFAITLVYMCYFSELTVSYAQNPKATEVVLPRGQGGGADGWGDPPPVATGPGPDDRSRPSQAAPQDPCATNAPGCQQLVVREGTDATQLQGGRHQTVAAQAQRRAEELAAKAEEARLTRAEVAQGLEARRTEAARQEFLAQPAHRFEETFINRDFAQPQSYQRIEETFNREIETARQVRDQNNYNAMGNFMTSMQLMQQAGQLTKTIQGMDSLDKNSPTASNNQAPQINPTLLAGGFPRPGSETNAGLGSAASASKNENGRSSGTTSEGTDFASSSSGKPEESKFMAGLLEGKELDKALGIKTSLVPPGFLQDLDKKLAGIQNEKELVDLLKKAGVDANIASLAGIKSLSEFGALAGKAIAAKTEEESGYSSGGGNRSQGAAEDDLSPNDIFQKLTEGIGRMEQVQDDSPKAKEFKGAREMLASNLDARLKLASKEAGSAKIAVAPNPNSPDARTPAQANCLPGEKCVAASPASSGFLGNLIFLGLGILSALGIIFWLRRSNQNKKYS